MSKRGTYLNVELARAIPMTDGTRRGFSGKAPRTTVKALSDCICYDADGNVLRTIARNPRTTRTPKPRHIVVKEQPMTYAERVRRFGATNEVY